MNFVVAG